MDVAGDILATLKRVAVLFDAHAIPYCLAGGLAVSLLARPRATEDVDLIILLEPDERAAFAAMLKKSLDVIQDQPVRTFRNASIWRFVLGCGDKGLVLLDLILADREEYRVAVRRANTIDLDGSPLRIIGIRDLITVKELAGRPVDLLDIEFLRDAINNGEE